MSSESITRSIYDISVTDLDGNEVKLDKFKGKCLLIVNIASDCKMMKENFSQLRKLKKKFSNGEGNISQSIIDNNAKLFVFRAYDSAVSL